MGHVGGPAADGVKGLQGRHQFVCGIDLDFESSPTQGANSGRETFGGHPKARQPLRPRRDHFHFPLAGCDGRQRHAVDEKTVDEFRGQMLGVRRAAAVAADHQLVAGLETVDDPVHQLKQLLLVDLVKIFLGGDGIGQAATKYIFHINMILVVMKGFKDKSGQSLCQ